MNTRFSFKAQVTWLSTCLILLTVIFLTISNWVRFADYAEAKIVEKIDIAQNVLNQTLDSQEQVLITTASVLASDFGFKQAVATKDKQTIKSVLINHSKRIEADLMLILDTAGNLQTSNSQYAFSEDVIEKSISKLPFKNIHAQIVSIENKVFQVIIVPVKAPRIIAYAIIGFEFDHDALLLFKDLISLEVSLVKKELDSKNKPKLRFIDSSLTDEEIKQQALLDTINKSPNLLFTRSDYYHKSIKFSSSKDVSAILSASLVQIQSDFNQLIFSISMIGLFVILIAITLSKVLSKSLSNPLNTLLTLTRRISRGELEIPKLNKKLPTEFSDLYQGFVVMGSAIVQREQEIKYQAERDILTGLYNRYKILSEIQNYVANDIHLLVITFNIKNFTTVNDTIGFKNADAVLIELACRTSAFIDYCQNNISNKGFAARINSDEFLVCLPIKNIDSIDRHIDRLRSGLEQPFLISDITLSVCLYYGISNSIEHGLDAEDLVRRSTMAASSASKNNECIKYYQQGEDEEYLNKLYLIEELKLALESSDSPLFMNYQPKLNITTGQVDKLEALIRWINKKGDFVNPEVFVGLAEQSGLIVTLTRWVILNVVKQVAQWNTSGYKCLLTSQLRIFKPQTLWNIY